MDLPTIRVEFIEAFDKLKADVRDSVNMPLRQEGLPGGFRYLASRISLFAERFELVRVCLYLLLLLTYFAVERCLPRRGDQSDPS